MQGSFSKLENKVMDRFTILTISSKVTYFNSFKTGFWPPAEVTCFYSLDWSEHSDFQKKHFSIWIQNLWEGSDSWQRLVLLLLLLGFEMHIFSAHFYGISEQKWKYNTFRYIISRIFLIDIWNSFKMLPWLLTQIPYMGNSPSYAWH